MRIVRRILATLAVCVLNFGLSIGYASAETVQLELQHGTFMVPVLINEAILLPFVLDTGATGVAIPSDVFLTLLRTRTVTKSDFVGTETCALADGSRQPCDLFVLREVKVGNHVVRNVIADVTPVEGDPLLGQSFLSKLRGWAVDNTHHTLILHDATVGEFMEWYKYCVSAKTANKKRCAPAASAAGLPPP
jgi:Aspartyl protease